MNTPEQRLVQSMHQDDDNVKPFDRRKQDRVLEMVLKQLESFGEKLDSHIESSAEHREAIAAKITGSEHIVATILEGFPNKDPRGHCDYHIDEMAAIARRKEFWSKLLSEVTKYGLIGLLGWIFMTLWTAALKGPK